MPTVEIEQAAVDLAGLIRRAGTGEEVVITENGTPVAKLVSAKGSGKRPGPGLWKGALTILSEDDDHLVDFAEYIT